MKQITTGKKREGPWLAAGSFAAGCVAPLLFLTGIMYQNALFFLSGPVAIVGFVAGLMASRAKVGNRLLAIGGMGINALLLTSYLAIVAMFIVLQFASRSGSAPG